MKIKKYFSFFQSLFLWFNDPYENKMKKFAEFDIVPKRVQ